MFATINLKQTRVGKSLAYDLTEYFRTRSPQKTLHDIARFLNSREGSPFFGRIKILGRAEGPDETITQAAFIEAMLPYLSSDPMMDRDTIKRGGSLERVPDGERRLVFRNLFIDQRDAEIAKIIWNYFAAVDARWPEAWRQVGRGNVLNRTTGLVALSRFLGDAYLSFERPSEIISQEDFATIFGSIDLNDGDFTPDRFKPGGSGQNDLYRELEVQTQRDLFRD
ncbi:MAG: DGQHR domain-containing protein, partial [Gemmatimonadetes bacterium]|nr:DGQHR domain-containing protein [Gemmatimonadota bacterium]